MNEMVLHARADVFASVGDLRIECCPDCDAPAEVEWSDQVGSTSGPLELVKVRCLNRHWFLNAGRGSARALIIWPKSGR